MTPICLHSPFSCKACPGNKKSTISINKYSQFRLLKQRYPLFRSTSIQHLSKFMHHYDSNKFNLKEKHIHNLNKTRHGGVEGWSKFGWDFDQTSTLGWMCRCLVEVWCRSLVDVWSTTLDLQFVPLIDIEQISTKLRMGLSRFGLNLVDFFYQNFIPGHALHEKSLQKQKSIGPLVRSQEQRALLVPRINRLPTARQLVVVFLHRFK